MNTSLGVSHHTSAPGARDQAVTSGNVIGAI